jgi:hypothetical protein
VNAWAASGQFNSDGNINKHLWEAGYRMREGLIVRLETEISGFPNQLFNQ